MTSLNRHSIMVNCRPDVLLNEIILWGEAVWWPKNSLMRFERKTKGVIAPGVVYRQSVLLPFAPSWNVEVESVTKNSITRRFLNGMFRGFETISFKPASSGFEVIYEMHYGLHGFFNKIMWPLIFRKLHDNNIEAILKNMKRYLEK